MKSELVLHLEDAAFALLAAALAVGVPAAAMLLSSLH
jgi:hypothetical protein